jgi:hypothetical protein
MSRPKVSNTRTSDALYQIAGALQEGYDGDPDSEGEIFVPLYIERDPELLERICNEIEAAARRLEPKYRNRK